jgi:molybdopterin converting factor small subunit
MPKLSFTPALKRFFPDLEEAYFPGETVEVLLDNIEAKYPGINTYLRDETGTLRKHINIFVDQALIQDRIQLQDALEEKQEVLIFQALSGG